MEIQEVIKTFNAEFSAIADKFCIYDLPLSTVATCTEEHVGKPGVYVYWKSSQVIKVGRHLTNARKRALEHISANTGGTMAELIHDSEVRLILFSLTDIEDKHWPAAVEIFLERKLKPLIPAGRLG